MHFFVTLPTHKVRSADGNGSLWAMDCKYMTTSKSSPYWVNADLSTKEKLEEFERLPLSARGLPKSTYDMLKHACLLEPDKTAIWFLASGEQSPTTAQPTTFRDLWRRINQTANLFTSLGVARDDVISVLMPAVTESQFVLWGGQAAGVVSPLNWMLEPEILASMLDASGARVLVVYGGDENVNLWDKVDAVLRTKTKIEVVVSAGGARREGDTIGGVRLVRYEDVIDDFSGEVLSSGRVILESDVAALFHTGGTTGTPKLAKQTHAAEVFSTWAYGMVYGTVPGDVRSCGIPIFHVGGALMNCLHTLGTGATLVLMTSVGWRHPSVIPNFWKIVANFRVTAAALVPTVINQLLHAPVGDADISCLAIGSTGTAPLSVHVADKFQTLTGVPLLETYGMTETTALTASNPREGVRKIGSGGLPFPYQKIKIVELEESGGKYRECGAGEPGTILISGPAVFDGYLDERANIGLFIDGVWLNTGDLGCLDSDGYLWITGREKDLIIRGGHNIDPQAIEEVYFKHPDVVDVAVVGAPHPHSGEVPVAYVVLKPGSRCTADDMLVYGGVAIPERAAIPKNCFLVDSIPKTSVGKTQKNALRVDSIQREYVRALVQANLGSVASVEVVDRGAAGVICRIVTSANGEGGQHESIKVALCAYTLPYEIVEMR